MYPSRVQIWTQGWVIPNSCPPLCTNLPPSEVGPEPWRDRGQPCGASPGYPTAHVGRQPLALTEAELSWLPSATGWGCPCQLHAGGFPALHPTAGFREGCCSLPEPSGSPLSCPALLSPYIHSSPVLWKHSYLCASDHVVSLSSFFAQLSPAFTQKQNARITSCTNST